jgi:hypothetical protein
MSAMKRVSSLSLCLMLLCAITLAAWGHPLCDNAQRGSLTITLQDGDTPVSGGSFTLYQVGDADEEDGTYCYRLSDTFLSSGVEITDLEDPLVAEDLAEFAVSSGAPGTTMEVEEGGNVEFPDLNHGLYLVVQQEAAPNYQPAEPFLVSIPQQVNGIYVYHVSATPKVALARIGVEPSPTPEETPEPEEPTLPAETVTPTPEPQPTETPAASATPTTTNPKTTQETPVTTSKLPQTGQLQWPIPVMVFAGLGCITLGWWLWITGKDERHEA